MVTLENLINAGFTAEDAEQFINQWDQGEEK